MRDLVARRGRASGTVQTDATTTRFCCHAGARSVDMRHRTRPDPGLAVAALGDELVEALSFERRTMTRTRDCSRNCSRRGDVMTDTDNLGEALGEALGTDFLRVTSELGEQEQDYLQRTRVFVRDEVLPVISDYWEQAEFPFELVRRMGELGLVGDGIDYPGVPPMTPASAGLVAMELTRGDGSLATFSGVQAGLAMRSIYHFGSEEQKQRWLPALARVEKFGAFALTEPDHGSDSVLLATTAVRDGDEYVLTGHKRWIGNGTIADVTVVWARGEDGQVGGYLVEKGTPGYDAKVITGKGSVRAV